MLACAKWLIQALRLHPPRPAIPSCALWVGADAVAATARQAEAEAEVAAAAATAVGAGPVDGSSAPVGESQPTASQRRPRSASAGATAAPDETARKRARRTPTPAAGSTVDGEAPEGPADTTSAATTPSRRRRAPAGPTSGGAVADAKESSGTSARAAVGPVDADGPAQAAARAVFLRAMAALDRSDDAVCPGSTSVLMDGGRVRMPSAPSPGAVTLDAVTKKWHVVAAGVRGGPPARLGGVYGEQRVCAGLRWSTGLRADAVARESPRRRDATRAGPRVCGP